MNTSNVNTSMEYDTIFSSNQYFIWFTLICVCIFPSTFCFLFDFYHVIKCRQTFIYSNINHHTILCLLINDFLQIIVCHPLSLAYFYFGHINYFYSFNFCLFWIYSNFTLINQSLVFTMYASVERYFLLFHKHFMLKYKIFTHYIPLLFVCLYLPCILFYLIFLYPCTQHFSPTVYECGLPCFYEPKVLSMLNQIIHIFLPVAVIITFNILIVVRVLIIKKRAPLSSSSNNLWKQNRHMILQLTTICSLASAAWLPYVVSVLIRLLGNPAFSSSIAFFYVINITYLPSFGTPFLALLGFPKEIRDKIFPCVIYLNRRKTQVQNQIRSI